jgi:hypothetical protein
MSPEEKLPEELKAFEAALASLTPSADRLSRDRVMYLAGQAALSATEGDSPIFSAKKSGQSPMPKTRWAWPAAFSAMTAVAATLAVLLVSQPAIRTANHAENPNAAPFVEGKTEHPSLAANQAVTSMSPEELEPLLADNAEFRGIDGRRPAWALELALSGRILPPSSGNAARQAETDSPLPKPRPTTRQLFEELFPGNPRYRL